MNDGLFDVPLRRHTRRYAARNVHESLRGLRDPLFERAAVRADHSLLHIALRRDALPLAAFDSGDRRLYVEAQPQPREQEI